MPRRRKRRVDSFEKNTPQKNIIYGGIWLGIIGSAVYFSGAYHSLFTKTEKDRTEYASKDSFHKDLPEETDLDLDIAKYRIETKINDQFSALASAYSTPHDVLSSCLINLKEVTRKVLANEAIEDDRFTGGSVVGAGSRPGDIDLTYIPPTNSMQDYGLLSPSNSNLSDIFSRFGSDFDQVLFMPSTDLNRTPEKEEEILKHTLEFGGLELEKLENSFTVGEIVLAFERFIKPGLTEQELEQQCHKVIAVIIEHYQTNPPANLGNGYEAFSDNSAMADVEVLDFKFSDGRLKKLPASCQSLLQELVQKYSYRPEYQESANQRHIKVLQAVTPLAIANFKQQYSEGDFSDNIEKGVLALFDENRTERENQQAFDDYFKKLDEVVRTDSALLQQERSRRVKVISNASEVARRQLNSYFTNKRMKNIDVVSVQASPQTIAANPLDSLQSQLNQEPDSEVDPLIALQQSLDMAGSANAVKSSNSLSALESLLNRKEDNSTENSLDDLESLLDKK